ncbi:MAG: hypothetical protein ABSC91_00980 [Candidatus Bathyarchaeia archaeon]|jgi:hypothetical protein
MTFEDYTGEKLWLVLVETVHTLTMYPNHKAYTRENILQEKSGIGVEELAARLTISLGEALVILYELALENKRQV